MIERLVSAVTDLPVIIQGAMGSALFAAFLFGAQRLQALVSRKIANSSVARKRIALLDELMLAHAAAATEFDRGAYFGTVALFRMVRHTVKGLLWMALGLMFNTVVEAFAIVGYLGCLYYLLQALRLAQSMDRKKAAERIKDINAQIEALNKAAGSPGEA